MGNYESDMPISKKLNSYRKLIISDSFKENDVKGISVTKAHGLLIDVQYNISYTCKCKSGKCDKKIAPASKTRQCVIPVVVVAENARIQPN